MTVKPVFLPAAALAQRSDVSYVMAAVPGVESQVLFETYQAEFGMAERSLPVFRLERSQQAYPSIMQRIQHRQRDLNRCGSGVGQPRPSVFGIGLDCRFFLGESELE